MNHVPTCQEWNSAIYLLDDKKSTRQSRSYICDGNIYFNDSSLKLVSARLPASEIMVLRGIVCILLAYLWVRKENQLSTIKSAFLNPLLIFRSFAESLCAFLFIASLSLASIADMTAIGLTAPLFIVALSIPMLGEKVSFRLWIIIIIGCFGMLLVMKPTGVESPLAGLLSLASAIILAFREVLTRKVKNSIPSVTVLLTSSVGVAAFALIPAPFQTWLMSTLTEIALMIFAAFTVVAANYLMIISHRDTDISTIAPFRYSILFWSILSGYLLWGDKPDFWSLVGMSLIVLSGLYTLKSEAKKPLD